MDNAPQERGIPAAPFVTDVAEFIGGADQDVMPTLQKFQEALSKYKFMEMSTTQRRKGLEQKIPDIAKTLQMVEFLRSRKEAPEPTELTFELNDTLYARATLDPIDKVHLWLGANVMLSYDIDEAIELLTDKLATARKNLEMAHADLGFLRDQITTMEVNTARVHNWDVKRRRDQREASARAA
ncbi:Part of the heteromeric co-chaperone GimC/prefoldin complex [Malassezia sympodialis ATCC 42132]|uniref:Prefoldin subunit 3 n=1 Tax=Malassezia sympodialis (strain ATCC 42132) TaxID=1230383 RepID=A0A1M8A164_MALS4|nr:Part of the heteromeric co-chaperone GimC/prefoldin complex [Malassezia sympodialis ATCC 42132]